MVLSVPVPILFDFVERVSLLLLFVLVLLFLLLLGGLPEADEAVAPF